MKVLKWISSLAIGIIAFIICMYLFNGIASWIGNLSFLGFIFENGFIASIVWFIIFLTVYGTAYSISYGIMMALPFNAMPPYKTFNILLTVYFIALAYSIYESNGRFAWFAEIPIIIMIIWCFIVMAITHRGAKEIRDSQEV